MFCRDEMIIVMERYFDCEADYPRRDYKGYAREESQLEVDKSILVGCTVS
jgi:hypothetical protein